MVDPKGNYHFLPIHKPKEPRLARSTRLEFSFLGTKKNVLDQTFRWTRMSSSAPPTSRPKLFPASRFAVCCDVFRHCS